jgi:cytochrome c oxidase cbb3-type subunit 3
MAKDERDTHTGYLTTGHEWNGITELNTPVPRVIFFFLISTVLFSLGYWVLMPTWPLGTTFTKGILGADQRVAVSESLKQAALDRATWTNLIEKESYAGIQGNPQLMEMVRTTGRTLFGDNCAACHGREAKGGKGFPNLTTNAWLWGGSPEAMAETIRVGINSGHPDSRVSQMPAFGRDRILERPDMENILAYVLSLSNSAASDVPTGKASSGKALFASNCASCHGDNAKGKTDVGAPDLTDAVWIYGGDAASVYTTIWGGRQGHMPTWEARLSPTDRKILVLYLIDLRKAAP